jgi:hypothetical protein
VADTRILLINLILYGLLPLWGITGFIDWWCHRRSRIEETTGLKESLAHSVMGLQLGIPIVMGLVFEINVLILLICFAALLSHSAVAHWDVRYSSPKRHITVWETHVHAYMATIPFFILLLIMIINWDVVLTLISLDWQGQFSLEPTGNAQVTSAYRRGYLIFMTVFCVFPYVEENLRCYLAARRARA